MIEDSISYNRRAKNCILADDDDDDAEKICILADDDDDELIMKRRQLFLLLSHHYLLGQPLGAPRSDRFFRLRMNWELHVWNLNKENKFTTYYRMQESSFNTLLDLIRPIITTQHHIYGEATITNGQ